jgi:hypothetical protein
MWVIGMNRSLRSLSVGEGLIAHWEKIQLVSLNLRQNTCIEIIGAVEQISALRSDVVG